MIRYTIAIVDHYGRGFEFTSESAKPSWLLHAARWLYTDFHIVRLP